MAMLRCRVRWSLVGSAVGVVLLLLAGGVGGPPGATAQSLVGSGGQATEVATTSDDPTLLLAYSPEDTFDDQIRSYVAAGSTDSGDVAEAKDVVAGMLETAQAGENLDLTFTPQSQDADVTQLQQALEYLEAISNGQSADSSELAMTEPEPEMEFQTPDNYPVRGEAMELAGVAPIRIASLSDGPSTQGALEIGLTSMPSILRNRRLQHSTIFML